MDRIFRFMELSQSDVFFDIGSGIGTLPLQASYTIGCHSIGLEVVKGRHEAAIEIKENVENRVRAWFGDTAKKVNLDFVNEDVKSPEGAKVFLDAIDDASSTGDGRLKAFLNNFEGILGDRSSGAKTGSSVEHYVAGQFASWPVGSQLVTISPLRCLGMPQERALAELKRQGLDAGCASLASFFTTDRLVVGPQNGVASWSSKSGCTWDVMAYKYTRIEQGGRQLAAFRCFNRACPVAQSGQAINAVKLDNNSLPLVDTCPCGYEPKMLRRPSQYDPMGVRRSSHL
jgi:hypothetical protein